MNAKPVIVVSATRFFQGGTLVIVNECLSYLSARYSATHTIKALIHRKELYEEVPGIEWIEFSHSRKSIFNRLYNEYIGFNRLSKEWKPILWLSLQDSTPRVHANARVVYFHNPLLLKPKGLNMWPHQPRLEILRLLYKYVYTKGIDQNDFVIAQQPGIAEYLMTHYHLPKEKMRLFPPAGQLKTQEEKQYIDRQIPYEPSGLKNVAGRSIQPFTFIYPATAFYYKNHALLLGACRLLKARDLDFRVWLTIDGSENSHIKKLVAAVNKELPEIQCLGFLKRDVLYDYYAKADCLVFPSLLESWGLPLSEFAGFNKPILCADLPYGRSTLSVIGYSHVAYFDPADAKVLAKKMADAIQGVFNFEPMATGGNAVDPSGGGLRQIRDWADCFNEILPQTC